MKAHNICQKRIFLKIAQKIKTIFVHLCGVKIFGNRLTRQKDDVNIMSDLLTGEREKQK